MRDNRDQINSLLEIYPARVVSALSEVEKGG
jgi:hypothetical protein